MQVVKLVGEFIDSDKLRVVGSSMFPCEVKPKFITKQIHRGIS